MLPGDKITRGYRSLRAIKTGSVVGDGTAAFCKSDQAMLKGGLVSGWDSFRSSNLRYLHVVPRLLACLFLVESDSS